MSEKRTRADNGSGTIRKRSDGRWEGRYTAPSGKQKSIYAKTEKACKAALKRVQAQIEMGMYVESSNVSLNEWLDIWMRSYAAHLKPTTRMNYDHYFTAHIKPRLGKRKLNKLKTMHIQAAFNDMANTLAPSTRKSIKIALSSALSTAVEYELIQANPCKGLKLARPQKQEIVIVDRGDLPAFVAEAKKSMYSAAILLLIQTGIRSGEMRGLRWEDIDFDKKIISVSRQIVTGPNGYIMQTLKDYQARPIIIMDETVDMLKQHKKDQAEMRIKAGDWQDTDMTRDLVFRDRHGRFIRPTMLSYHINKIGTAIGIQGLHPHSLRDSYAVAALRSGIDIKTIQNNLGHSDAAMTLNTYATYTHDMGMVAAQKLSEYWRENQN